MRLYDTAAEVVPFEPADHVVTMYTCGITPYDSTHLGHAATYLTYDVLQRRLRDLGHETRCVRNITDVDDEHPAQGPRARACTTSTWPRPRSPASTPTWSALEMLPAWSEPRATSAIADIRGFIGMVLDQGYAYQAGGAVYFEVAKFPNVRLDQRTTAASEMLEFAAERGGNVDDPHKRDPLDFVLWQPSPGRRAGVGLAVGPGPTRLAHRVLGAVPARARHHDRPARWWHRPDLPAPRVRGRPVRGGHRRAVRASLDAPGDGPHGRREDVEVARQPRVRLRAVEGLGPPGDPPGVRRRTTTGTAGSGTTTLMPAATERLTAWVAAGDGDARARRGARRARRRSRHARARSLRSTLRPQRASGCRRGGAAAGCRRGPSGVLAELNHVRR